MEKEELIDKFINENMDILTKENINEDKEEISKRLNMFIEKNGLTEDKYFNKVLQIFSKTEEDIKPYEIKRKQTQKGKCK